MVRSALLLVVAAVVVAAEPLDRDAELAALKELVAALPDPPVVQPQPGDPGFPTADFPVTGVLLHEGQVILRGVAVVDQGPVDGLEVMACLEGGKVHESYARLLARQGSLVKAACLAAFDLPDGVPAQEDSFVPARGWPLFVELWWQPEPDFQPDLWHHLPLSSLVRDRVVEQAYPVLPYIYTGSRVAVVDQPGSDGKLIQTKRFMLDITKSVFVNWDESDALLASPSPLAGRDDVFEVRSDVAPAEGSTVYFAIRRDVLPLIWQLDDAGRLLAGDQVLDPAEVIERLQRAFGADAPTSRPRCIAVRVPATTDDRTVVDCRRQLLAAAAEAGVWAVPVFLPAFVWPGGP